ncbi:2-5 RNA ligase superfamily [uncultured virus]|nr:2-5 RNA ligase superfamily [uncultured virus]
MKYTPACSLVIMPPKETWDQFVEIKKNHMNPKIKRPPYPHITLLQTFVEKEYFDQVFDILSTELKKIQPFKCSINEFKLFKNKKSQTLYLDPICDPPDSFNKLYKIVKESFPEIKTQTEFNAHMGIGYFNDLKLSQNLLEKYQNDWVPIEFIVKEIYINFREDIDAPFSPRKIIHLGHDNTPSYNDIIN